MLARLTPKAAITPVVAQPASPDLKGSAVKTLQGVPEAGAAAAALTALRQTGKKEGLKALRQVLGQAPLAGAAGDPSKALLQMRGENDSAHSDKKGGDHAESGFAHEETTDWAVLEARIRACEACGLHAGRHRAVPGAGAVESVDWLVVGEAPGDRDDRLGEPFQGKAGELLHAMLDAAGIDSKNKVFYTNLVKCRPRSNRPPGSDEIAACSTYLRAQIGLLRPRGILVLGRLAAQALVADGKPFEEQRGRVHVFKLDGGDTIPLVVTYHPASLLSRPQHKAASWRDLNLANGV